MTEIRGTVEAKGSWSGDLVVPASGQDLILTRDRAVSGPSASAAGTSSAPRA